MRRSIAKVIGILMLIASILLASDYEKIISYQIGPGVTYSYYEGISRSRAVHLTEIDLENPYISLETVKANNKLLSKERPSSMSSRLDADNHRSVCAINGDFYNTANGQPINNQVSNGEFVQGFTSNWSAFTYSESGTPSIIRPVFNSVVVLKDSSGLPVSNTLHSVNRSRWENNLVLYNEYIGSSTQTNQWGTECLLNPISEWNVNDTVLAVVEHVEIGYGDNQKDMAIPSGKVVLSGNGTADTYLRNYCHVGDTIKIALGLAHTPDRVTQLVGGGPWILRNGVDVTSEDIEGLGSGFWGVRHPRTGVGISADSTKAYFMVVDGRSSISVGMTCPEMSQFFLEVGAEHAINLDGGGSSSFVVRNSVKNQPSDGSERSVANALVCVSSAPNGSFTHLQSSTDSVAVYKNQSMYLGFTGWDEYYNPTGIPDWSQINISYDSSLGNFDSNVFTAYENNGDTYVKAEYNGNKDSIKVHIIELTELSVYPDTLTLDSVNSVEYQVSAKTETGGSRVFSNDLFSFTLLDSNIASISETGVIIGKQSGETQVIVAYGDQKDTVLAKIQIGEGEVVVDELETLDGWYLSTDAFIVDNETSISLCDRIAGSGSKAIRVDYSRTGSSDGNIYLDVAPVDLYGVPSDILIDVLSDSIKHWIYVLLEDNRGVEYSVKSSSSLRYNDDYRTQYLDLKNLLPADGEQLYPLKFKGIRLRIDDKATTGTLYLDRVRIIYPTWTAIEDHDINAIPEDFNLLQNYPNPFNPSTTIDYQLSSDANVDLSIYTLSGKKVATLVYGIRAAGSHSIRFDASDLAGGIYFYRLQAGNWVDTRKMLLIK